MLQHNKFHVIIHRLINPCHRIRNSLIKWLIVCIVSLIILNSKSTAQQYDKPAILDETANASLTSFTNPLLDATTALFYHVENTKTCGTNLQQLNNINLEPVWNRKFDQQIKKALKLTNSINHLINNIHGDTDDKQQSVKYSSPSNNNNLLNFHIIESHLLSSLSYFMFSQSQNGQFNSAISINSLLSQKDQSSSSSSNDAYINDPFIKGYGVVLFDDSAEKSDDKTKCLFISQSQQSGEKYKKEASCQSMNIKTSDATSPLSPSSADEDSNLDNKNSNLPNYVMMLNSYNKAYSNGNSNVNLNLNDQSDGTINLNNCVYWLKNLKEVYDEFLSVQKQNNLVSSAISYQAHLESYLVFLNNRSSVKMKASALWCGPYYDCSSSSYLNSKKLNDWILIYSLPLFDKDKELRGAVSIKIMLTKMDVNQCRNGDPVFADTHKCKPYSECIFTPKNTFTSGNYKCKCRAGYINSNKTFAAYDGKSLESQYWLMKSMKNNTYQNEFNCIPCLGKECCNGDWSQFEKALLNANEDDEIVKEYSESNIFWNCRKYNMTLRNAIFIVQILSILVTFSLAVIVFYSRQNKIIKHSMWILLEIILFGAILLYSTLIIQYFEPTNNACLAIPWFRELGFTVVYGILNLRLYKILIEFQSRKAHVVHLKDKDILKILFFIVVCVLGYLTAWTLVDIDYASEGFSLLTNTSLKGFIQFPVCKIKWWDYFIEIAEFLFICVGFYLIYCTRTAPSEFNERKFISLVIYFEGFVSTFLYIIKHSIFISIHPDTILALYFFRCHSTVTVMILFIFFTKLCFLMKNNSEGYCRNSRLSTVDGSEVIISPDSIKFQIGHGPNDNEIGEMNVIDMEPEEIRVELKRLYTQLHVFKTKSIKTDNPHLQSKRRANRNKNLRKLSTTIQKNANNAMANNNKEHESYQVKTPDESICSNEANLPHSTANSEDQNNKN